MRVTYVTIVDMLNIKCMHLHSGISILLFCFVLLCFSTVHATSFGNNLYASGTDCILKFCVCVLHGVKRNTSKMC